ncbi:MAG: geranylgeranyl reductase family protein [Patescibacteria group bacterium]
MYDVIVVGGETIGLFLANKFAEKGYSVLLVERKKETGDKVCSGLVSSSFLNLIEDDGGWVEKEFSGARIWIEEEFFDFKGKALLLNRKALNGCLKKNALKKGVDFILGKDLTRAREERSFVEITLRNGEGARGKILAGCDGANSIVAREVGLPAQGKFLLGVICYEEKRDEEGQKNDAPELLFKKDFAGFFAWRIPRKDSIEWGTALPPSLFPGRKLRAFLDKMGIKVKKMSGALIPVSPRKKTVTKRCFLCGDSAGQIKPATGGGLIYGLLSAKIASELIRPESPNTLLYEKSWRRKLEREIALGLFLKSCYRLPNFAKKIGISWLQRKNNLDQDNPSTIFRNWRKN